MLVTIDWLMTNLKDPNLRVIDCRSSLQDPTYGYQAYQQEHIPGAVYLDLKQNLSAPKSKHGGRHPLPDPTQLAKKLGQLGISEKNKVVVYDDDGGMFAGRVWWLLTYLGHPQVHVLEQGWQEWKARRLPTKQTIPTWEPSTFTVNLQPQMIASREEVLQKMHSPSTTLIDARAKARYLGEEEPIDAIAGHIPQALHYFWKQVHGPENKWKEPQQLQEHFAALSPDQEIIVYCGSGVSATPNIMALQLAGFSHVKLYPGGWSDWISYEEAPVAKGEELLGQKAKPAK